MMVKRLLLTLVSLAPMVSFAFVAQSTPKSFIIAGQTSTTIRAIGPFQKLTNKKNYDSIVNNLMETKGFTREQAEKEYNDYLNNPNDYALQKVECIMVLRR